MTGLLLMMALGVSPGAETSARESYRAGVRERDDTRRAQPHFRKAAELYDQAWLTAPSAALARNRAQAHWLAGDLARSIAAYRAGLAIYPHDVELRRGLAALREHVAFSNKIAEAARPRDDDSILLRSPIAPKQLAWIAVALAAIGWLIIARAWITRQGGLAIVGGGLLAIALLIGIGIAWKHRQSAAQWSQPTAIVATNGVELRTGNSDEYTRRLDGRLPLGVEAKILGERGGWVQVELPGGSVGWLRRDQVVLAPS